jgi:hypothetical protein
VDGEIGGSEVRGLLWLPHRQMSNGSQSLDWCRRRGEGREVKGSMRLSQRQMSQRSHGQGWMI